jgi:hypothetical protein
VREWAYNLFITVKLKITAPSMRGFLHLIFLATLLAWFAPKQAKAQITVKNTQYRVHCIYIYNFTRYIQWPADYSSGDFVIGVLGDSPLLEELDKLAATKTVNGRRIVITKYKSPPKKGCHILFIPEEKSDALSSALNTCDKNTLIVTEKAGMARIGSFINFVSAEGKPKFELNTSALDKTELKVMTELKTIAILI